MPTAYIGIGSNLADRKDNCERAIKLLEAGNVKVNKRSSMIETEPWVVEDQPRFVNMAVEIETGLEPEELLSLLKKIEFEIGRVPAERWGPRIIDLDILLYDDLILTKQELEIPHPHIAEREFVLKPLAEIAPEMIHPVLKKSIRDLFLQFLQSS